MTDVEVQKIPVRALTAERIASLREVVAVYFEEPDSGLSEELRHGNLVYLVEGDHGSISCFLIVDFDHQRTTIDGKIHRFTYLGLGCATASSMAPVFWKVKSDFSERLTEGTVGVLHLTTRTPFAYHGVERAYGGDLFPTGRDPERPEARRVARYIKESIHGQPVLSDGDNPFLLREVKKGPFSPQEVSRIGAFRGDSPILKLGVTCDGRDEVIVFHTFMV